MRKLIYLLSGILAIIAGFILAWIFDEPEPFPPLPPVVIVETPVERTIESFVVDKIDPKSKPPKLGVVEEESLYAHINENNIVDSVIVITTQTITKKGGWYVNGVFKPIGEWRKTDSQGTVRKNYAGFGYIYNTQVDAFVAPKPNVNFTLDLNTMKWKLPTLEPKTSATST